jgi:hypothetical protein
MKTGWPVLMILLVSNSYTYPAKVQMALKRYFENVCLVSILKSKYTLKGIFLCIFSGYLKRTQKPWKNSYRSFLITRWVIVIIQL